MTKNKFNLTKEKEALENWLKSILENNPEEVENHQMVDFIKERIKQIEEKFKTNI